MILRLAKTLKYIPVFNCWCVTLFQRAVKLVGGKRVTWKSLKYISILLFGYLMKLFEINKKYCSYKLYLVVVLEKRKMLF